MKALTEDQIIDDWFHEYCEGRCEKDEMVKVLKAYALQSSPSPVVVPDEEKQCKNCKWFEIGYGNCVWCSRNSYRNSKDISCKDHWQDNIKDK